MTSEKCSDENQTDWRSMWICIFLSVCSRSSNLRVLHVNVAIFEWNFDFLGWVVAACSIGCTISNPLYGYWNQKTMSAVFTPLGEEGIQFGGLVLNMYTVVSYLMVLICIFGCLIIYFFFNESYVGIVTKEEQEKDDVQVPMFDIPAALICIYLFMIVNMTATNIEVYGFSKKMSSPLTTVLYDWKDSDSIFYNGIALAISSAISVSFNIAQGATRIGKIDKRKQMLFGLTFFLLYQLFMYPWGFYSGPLNFLPKGMETTEAGGCYAEYLWCNETTRVPIFIYFFCFIVFFGVAFPFVETPSPALFSEILGPRKQGTMQGFFSLGGSLAPVIASITSTAIFKYSGYRYVIVLQASTLLIAIVLILIFYKRLVPLKVIKKCKESTVSSKN
ncbi:hypothetical protein CAEBREN_03800 [Caenorhabditis brenneri]|uniref:Major facilitator superfamily (MFS) profile domain-containing protein n=1 Tax=Caenorhabditis brenneri TaxID=135651 RepID=G0MXS1_CAEBE|nr:hypothetical protein CAEBREN_03800 [Caenorhabditis brenneri]